MLLTPSGQLVPDVGTLGLCSIIYENFLVGGWTEETKNLTPFTVIVQLHVPSSDVPAINT